MFGSFSFGYDFGVALTGLSENSEVRKDSIKALNLETGETVFDICCGTGLNFKLLENKIGIEGKIIGVDLTPQMLEIAKSKSEKKGMKSIDLINSNILSFKTDKAGDCAICTASMGMIPEFNKAIDIVMENISANGRFAIVDFKKSQKYPSKIFNPFIYLLSKSANFNVNKRDVIAYIKSKYKVTYYKEYLGGFCYTIVFERHFKH
jgi:ubiquinone/menaquinone biosynthesis C-methylase UbiE